MTKQRTRGRRPEMRIRKDGYAFVELIYNGKAKRRYLGKIRNAQDRRAYQKEAERIIGEYLANGRKAPITKSGEAITIRELSARYFARAKEQHTTQPKTLRHIKTAIRFLITHFGGRQVTEFTPDSLESLQRILIQNNYALESVNRYITIVRSIFKQGAGYGWYEDERIYTRLTLVPNLRKDRNPGVRCYRQILPVERSLVLATLPYLSPVVAGIIMKKDRFKELFSKPAQNYPDVAVEILLLVREASKVLGVARPTVERWFSGYTQSGVALESCTVGFRRKTSREAIARFLRRQNESRLPEASRDNDTWDDARTDAVLHCYVALHNGMPVSFCAIMVNVGHKNRKRISRLVSRGATVTLAAHQRHGTYGAVLSLAGVSPILSILECVHSTVNLQG